MASPTNKESSTTPSTATSIENTPFDEDFAATMDEADESLMRGGGGGGEADPSNNNSNNNNNNPSVSFADEPPLVEDVTRDDQSNSNMPRRKSSLVLKKSLKHHHSMGHDNNHVDNDPTTIKTAGDHMDLSTGATTTRCQTVTRVAMDEQQPYNKHTWNYRWGKRVKQAEDTVSNVPLVGDVVDAVTPTKGGGEETTPVEDKDKQYRIVSKLRDDSNDPWLQWKLSAKAQQESFNVSWLSKYLHWTFRASFFDVFLSSFVGFMTLITVFALVVYGIDHHQPQCIVGIDREVDEETGEITSHIPFGDAWHLSWTTLSTVGYGVIAPGMPSTTIDQRRCTGINMLMAFESFVGVLFGGITGAIVFAKVARIQSVAPIVWSDPVVVRYGSGCVERAKDYDDKEVKQWDKEASESTKLKALESNVSSACDETTEIPCPILEFRLVNNMWKTSGGEIMDACVNLVVSRLETPHEMDMRNQMRRKRRPGKKGKRKKVPMRDPRTTPSVGPPLDGNSSTPSSTPSKEEENVSTSSRSLASSFRQKKVKLFEEAKAGIAASGTFLQKINNSIISSAVAAAHLPISPSSGSHQSNEEEPQPYNKQQEQEKRDLDQLQQQQELEKQIEDAVEQEVTLRMSKAVHEAVQAQQQQTMAVDEGNGEDEELAPRRIFQTLEVQTDSHPFFKRTWNIRHVCNENSPLLSLRVRNMIVANDGFWPAELNSYEEVRKAINFHEIIVSFSGTANVSGSSLYTQKIYNYVDMAVGYTFANLLALDKDGKLIVDSHLLNDVKEQRGGGAEPIRRKDDANFDGYSKDEETTMSMLPVEEDSEHTDYDQEVREEKKEGDEIV